LYGIVCKFFLQGFLAKKNAKSIVEIEGRLRCKEQGILGRVELKRVIFLSHIEPRTARFSKTFERDSSKIIEIGKWWR